MSGEDPGTGPFGARRDPHIPGGALEKAKTSPESVSGRTREPECSRAGMPGS